AYESPALPLSYSAAVGDSIAEREDRAIAAHRRRTLPGPRAPAAIVSRDDRALNPAWGRSAARDRLGVEPVEIDGSRSPFLSRPAELAGLLDTIGR
ncbi:MAG TPA: hypothetical protein VIK65_12980, partial [Candidatus Limnocylindrales bacterium]